jgi:phenylalanyl-tRNA synthetase beta chain
MRVSLQWLRELVEAPEDTLQVEVLAERLSLAGFEVESIDDQAARVAGVVVGQVLDRQAHPNADKLSVCQVDVGGKAPLQIVCGAPNVRAGLHVPVALVGATLPAVGLTIKDAQLRGVASTGMICSLQELGLADTSNGIAVLEDLLPSLPAVGSPIGPCFDLDDQVLELAITANRPDGLSMRGLAREVAALSGGRAIEIQVPVACEPLQLELPPSDLAAIEAGGLFSMTAIEGLRVEPSPAWLQRRLARCGLRPINNIVDITNLVMLETGQPLHAFDQQALARLQAGSAPNPNPHALGLRQGRPGERLNCLDGQDRALDQDVLLVTYADQPIALAGVMGGLAEAVNDRTTAVWLEAAVFPPQAVRRSSRRVGLRTEASSRFEKGLPPQATLAASDRAVQLLVELAGGKVQGRWLHQRARPAAPAVLLRRDSLHQLLGPVLVDGEPRDLDDGRIEATLTALGCQLSVSDAGWLVNVPPSRQRDLCREVDLIEEVARLVGYDSFAAHLPDPLVPGGLEPSQQLERRLRRSLCSAGLQEVCGFSLVPEAPGRLSLANPLLADYGHLRDELHTELLQAACRNLQASRSGFWAFEIGRVFLPSGGSEPLERLLLAGVICGERRSELWSSNGKPAPPGYWSARGLLQAALDPLRIPIEDREPSGRESDPIAALLHPGRRAVLAVEGRAAGWFGQLHPAQAEALELPEATYLFEMPLEPILTAASRRNRWLPSFATFATVPASERDLALLVPSSTTTAALLNAIRKAGKPLLEQAELVDRYSGEQVPAGYCSQAFRLRYRDSSRTLTDAEVETAHDSVLKALERQFKAQRRS